MTLIAANYCAGSGGPVSQDGSGLCPVCSLPIYEPMTPAGEYVVARHQPYVDSIHKIGIHSPSCRLASDDDCICTGVAA